MEDTMGTRTNPLRSALLLFSLLLIARSGFAVQLPERRISGVVVTAKNEVVKDVSLVVRGQDPEKRTITNEDGKFSLDIPGEEVTLRIEGPYIKPQERTIRAADTSTDLRF